MTKPRPSPHRELYGIIGHVPDASRILKQWNAAFRERGIDASLDVYPTTEKNLPERLSEMFHFDRRGYLVGNDLSKVIIPLLDRVEPAARRRPSSAKASEGEGVAFVWNEGGILKGERSDVNLTRLEFIPGISTLFACSTPSSKKRN
ncbi:MAG TPA: hypothetical protein DDX11_03885 [Candidatus Peribacter riflensis]|nr:MAG: hypothetical protein A2398_00495 [Candidatus Peribacteria bacterium RIFOXYB1_FULL_57_12]OGJ82470.1 MAG: hypothetical protein A2412_03185 [Candidatus Peribacteria bacterium RIFOXYC1_FULL_58_8]HBH20083.1 hypothetical protein [Candidatus Peribacter riflensis]